jgi:hypothetical protein
MKTLHRKLMEKADIVSRKDSNSQAAVKMSLAETAGRAALTATVTFAVGWVLKRMFEKTVEQAATQQHPRIRPSSLGTNPPASYRSPLKRPTGD